MISIHVMNADMWEVALTHCSLPTSYNDLDEGQHWFRQWLVAWWHQDIAWTNVDLSSVGSSDILLRTISQEIPQPSITKTSMKIAYLKFHSDHSEANELMRFQMLPTHNIHLVKQQMREMVYLVDDVTVKFQFCLKLIIQQLMWKTFP